MGAYVVDLEKKKRNLLSFDAYSKSKKKAIQTPFNRYYKCVCKELFTLLIRVSSSQVHEYCILGQVGIFIYYLGGFGSLLIHSICGVFIEEEECISILCISFLLFFLFLFISDK